MIVNNTLQPENVYFIVVHMHKKRITEGVVTVTDSLWLSQAEAL